VQATNDADNRQEIAKSGLHRINQAYSEYKHVLATILRSRYVARTPPLEARVPGRRSNVENAPVDDQSKFYLIFIMPALCSCVTVFYRSLSVFVFTALPVIIKVLSYLILS